jgi:prepilin-type N-terminal cleavage/methylation domain-containing protein
MKGSRSAFAVGTVPTSTTHGFTLIECLVSLFLLGVAGVLVALAYTFSIESQREAQLQSEATRSAAQVMEILRTQDFDSIELLEDGWPILDNFLPPERVVLEAARERLERNGMKILVTVRVFEERNDSRYVAVTVLSESLSSTISALDLLRGEILVKLATVVTRRGLNP